VLIIDDRIRLEIIIIILGGEYKLRRDSKIIEWE